MNAGVAAPTIVWSAARTKPGRDKFIPAVDTPTGAKYVCLCECIRVAGRDPLFFTARGCTSGGERTGGRKRTTAR